MSCTLDATCCQAYSGSRVRNVPDDMTRSRYAGFFIIFTIRYRAGVVHSTNHGSDAMKKSLSAAVFAGLILVAAGARGADVDTSTLTCQKGFKLGVYDEPREGTRPWHGKHLRCEQTAITCPPLMKPVYHDTEVFGSTPLDNGKFVRCEEIPGPPSITCPPPKKPVYHDTEVSGSTPMDNGKFFRCEEISGSPN